ncbi:MAG: 2-C-methyl-D-erythritol 2,4-cyclodiphosphate synthase [Bacteroidetes bacterium]|nr:2-C-methyl-D-erythritol 2,4-cyclodiphosphate synthase [Bacteroidota bacterium]MCW5896997.1 2-C-methyl-D-erythritol 2,4-cyclodiphosphate synthase [Bacteroidota bacterium]
MQSYPRIGFGFDVHRFVNGRKLVLGGVEIPHDQGLDGHSDADIVLHSLMDALLGAAALGDIGKHFPNTDPAYKGISSLKLLKHVGELLAKSGVSIVNLDITVVMEHPKIHPYVPRMQKNIAETLGMQESDVSVKATTNEGLGFIGKGDGAAAHAVVCIVKE